MTSKAKLLLVIGIILAPVLTLISTILRAAALFTEFDKESGYFSSPAILHTTYLWVAVIGLVLFIAFSILCRKHFYTPTYRNSLSVLFSSAFFVVTLAVAALLGILAIPTATSALTKIFWLIAVVSAVLALVYFALFFIKEKAGGSIHGLLGLAPAFFCLFTAMLFYFDRTLQMNAPAKLLHLLAFLLLASYFTAESRGILAETKRPFFYVLASASMLFSFSSAIPNLLYNLIEGKVLVITSVYDFLLLAAALYTLARLLQMLPYEYPSVHRMVQLFLQRTQEEAEEAEEESEPEEVATIEELLGAEPTETDTTPDTGSNA